MRLPGGRSMKPKQPSRAGVRVRWANMRFTLASDIPMRAASAAWVMPWARSAR
jgi:hypothetical protein